MRIRKHIRWKDGEIEGKKRGISEKQNGGERPWIDCEVEVKDAIRLKKVWKMPDSRITDK